MGKVAGIAQQALGVFSGQMMTRAVDSLVNLGKTALSSVGALEQNVGGVETLFGDTADAVIAAADRAYQTAGMSANDYMSTVTSFSASLLQSLGGNTEEAAKVADMAIKMWLISFQTTTRQKKSQRCFRSRCRTF